MTHNEDEKISLRLDLEHQEAEDFKAFKERHGLKNNLEALRVAIAYAYRYEKLTTKEATAR